MSSDLTSDPTNIQFLDNVGIQGSWTGNATGTFGVQISADFARDNNGNVTNEGHWIDITLSPVPAAAGTGDAFYVDLNQLSAPYIRLTYANTLVESANITAVADTAGSLNSTYFLIDGADGDDWYVWYDNGGGVDPAPANRTGIHVVYTTADTANTIATLTRSALSACTSITTIGGSTSHITFVQSTAGAGDARDSIGAPTGFGFAYVSNTGILNAYVTAKTL